MLTSQTGRAPTGDFVTGANASLIAPPSIGHVSPQTGVAQTGLFVTGGRGGTVAAGVEILNTFGRWTVHATLTTTGPSVTVPGALVVAQSLPLFARPSVSSAGGRRVASDTQAAASQASSSPCFLVEIEWPSFSSKLCTYGDVSWDGNAWSGADLQLTFDQKSGAPQTLTMIDAQGVYRTLALLYGIRDRRITVWHAYIDALSVDGPVLLPNAWGDQLDIDFDRITISLGRASSSRSTTPRQRIGPGIGVTQLAQDGYTFQWGGRTVTLHSRSSR